MKYIKSYKKFEGKLSCDKCGAYTDGMQDGNLCYFCKSKNREEEPNKLYCTICSEYIGDDSGDKCNSCRDKED